MVIMIDDDDDALEIYQLLLDRTNCAQHFYTFNSGFKAFEFLDQCVKEQRSFPKYILLDLNMPDIGGIEFIEKYEEQYIRQHADTKIIMLTSSVRETDNEMALSYDSVAAFKSKPLAKDDLIAMIQESLQD